MSIFEILTAIIGLILLLAGIFVFSKGWKIKGDSNQIAAGIALGAKAVCYVFGVLLGGSGALILVLQVIPHLFK